MPIEPRKPKSTLLSCVFGIDILGPAANVNFHNLIPNWIDISFELFITPYSPIIPTDSNWSFKVFLFLSNCKFTLEVAESIDSRALFFSFAFRGDIFLVHI